MEAMKGMSWESPRGPISIDPATRDIVQNIYMRTVERRNGELYNIDLRRFRRSKILLIEETTTGWWRR
jgi:branched-chain amino acid transport system substrate-binding protein